MSEGSPNLLASVPPWVYLVVILGGGGIGGLQMGGSAPAPVVEQTCDDAEERAREALAAWKGMIESYGLLLTELGQCRQE
jgi:hypothetical protein